MGFEPTDEQKSIIHHMDGPAAVLACPGSGKTFSVIERIAYLIKQGVPEYTILGITFTNNAAKEMLDRLESKLGSRPKCTMSTFHALCCRFLRQDGDEVFNGVYNPRFSIMDEDDAVRLVRKEMRQYSFPDKLQASAMLNMCRILLNGFTPKAMINMNDREKSNIKAISKVYQDWKITSNLLSFDDLIEYGKKLVSQSDRYSHRYKYVLVDEFQDSDELNLQIAIGIARHNNIMAVGDCDQSIYGFRGAVPDIFNQYIKETGAKVLHLSETRRLSKRVATTCNKLISYASDRQYAVPMKAHSSEPGFVTYKKFESCDEETEFLTDFARTL